MDLTNSNLVRTSRINFWIQTIRGLKVLFSVFFVVVDQILIAKSGNLLNVSVDEKIDFNESQKQLHLLGKHHYPATP